VVPAGALTVSGILGRLLVIVVLGVIVSLGLRRIYRDWTRAFRADDARRHQRDLAERDRPDVLDLKRSADGVFRPDPKEPDGRD
jgi:hypothetical protein